LAVQEHFGDLVVGTYGRGFWILDDISPLRQLTDEVRSSNAHLFAPRDAYRFNARTSPQSPAADPTVGANPQNAAYLNYWLSEEVAGGPVEIRISDASGDLVRTMTGSSRAGLNRVFWNYRGEASTPFRNRTTPLFADWIDLGPERMRVTNGMSLRHAPGTYTVTLDVDGQEYSQQLTVLKDPDSEGTQADIVAQLELLAEVRADYESAAEAVNRIEWLRRQLNDLIEVLDGQGNAEDLVSGANDLGAALISVEEEIMQIRLTGTGQDEVRFKSKLVRQLSHLAGGVASADFRPTDQQREVQVLLRSRLEAARVQLDVLLDSELAEFNQRLRSRGLSPLISDGEG
jgi:hypothetical protein